MSDYAVAVAVVAVGGGQGAGGGRPAGVLDFLAEMPAAVVQVVHGPVGGRVVGRANHAGQVAQVVVGVRGSVLAVVTLSTCKSYRGDARRAITNAPRAIASIGTAERRKTELGRPLSRADAGTTCANAAAPARA